MNRSVLLGLVVLALGFPIQAGGQGSGSVVPAPSCSLSMIAGPYTLQCHGSAFNGISLEPVSVVGTVTNTASGFAEGYGTFNSSGGSVSTHFTGQATLGPSCTTTVTYTTYEILLPGGGTVPLPPVSFQAVIVLGGKELLGAGIAPPGVTGDLVPRMVCRLVRQRR